MLISEDYRQEVFEHFPQLPKKEIYYELTKQVTQAFVEKANVIQDPKPIKDFNNISCGWKITNLVLKRLDLLVASWKLPEEIPVDVFLDYPVFSIQSFTKDCSLWQEQSKHFSTTWTPPYPVTSKPVSVGGKLKINSSRVTRRLEYFLNVMNPGE
ncbi:hypothetical protein BY458DRAFT_552349 [Sporodiniella umbellata]|nr:hypothetical protein BY458DRAFT_552349 [Sporodiniella umbellata]